MTDFAMGCNVALVFATSAIDLYVHSLRSTKRDLPSHFY
jgi:hypothetical protein